MVAGTQTRHVRGHLSIEWSVGSVTMRETVCNLSGFKCVSGKRTQAPSLRRPYIRWCVGSPHPWRKVEEDVLVFKGQPGESAAVLKSPPHILSVSDQFRVTGPTGLPLTPPVVTQHGAPTHTPRHSQTPVHIAPTHGNYYLILNSKGNHFISQKANYQPSKYLENEMNSDLLLYLGFLHGKSNSGFKQSWERKINVR